MATNGKQNPQAAGGGPSVSMLERMLGDEVGEEIELTGGDIPIQQETRKRRRTTTSQVRWVSDVKLMIGWMGLWGLLFATTLLYRVVWPSDETRFLAVAWEMWQRQDSLIPALNGYVYSQHPPLLMWLVHTGWQLFGVNEWWPRAVPALFGLASLFLLNQLSQQLWPGKHQTQRYAPYVFIGTPVLAASLVLALPLVALLACTLLTMLGLMRMARHGGFGSWLLAGIGLGLGGLASGLSIYWYVLPVALLAPLWHDKNAARRGAAWYGDVIKAVLVSALLFGAWFYPFSQQVGQEQALILLKGYVWPQAMDLFSSEQPLWWYLFFAPLALLPWVIWPLPWLRFWSIRKEPMNTGVRFCLVWGFVTLGMLSFYSVRQPQFLLPILPAFILLATHFIMDDDFFGVAEDSAIASMNFPVILIGGVLLFLPGLPRIDVLPAFLWELSPFVGIGIAIFGFVLGWLPTAGVPMRTMNIGLTSTLLVVFAIFFVGWRYNTLFDISEVAKVLAQAETQGRPLAHVGNYQGQYQFAARLQQPLTELQPDEIATWAAGHRDGLLISYADGWQPQSGSDEPVYQASYGKTQVVIWKAWYLGQR